MLPARPTLRCLRDDLKLAVPPVGQPLDAIDHPLLAKTSEQFADLTTSRTRIAAIDDNILFKVKVGRYRGAVWVGSDPQLPWLVAGGWREAGSDDDFYDGLEASATQAKLRYNANHKPTLTTKTYTARLLPDAEDRDRYEAEAGMRQVRALRAIVEELVRASLRDGHEHTATLDAFTLGIQVRADHGHETYVAIRITGSVPEGIVFTVLDLVPGCAFEDWMPEFDLPDRLIEPGEYVFSNLMDPVEAAKVLDID
jgi:hypothetical protein